MGKIILEEQVAPSTPAADKVAIYPKAGGGLFKKDDAGVELRLDGAAMSEQSVNDESQIALDTGKTGWGFAQAGDNEEWIQFSFTTAGVVTVIANSANAVNADTDGNLCVYDAGTGIAIKNRLGATKTIRYVVNYSA